MLRRRARRSWGALGRWDFEAKLQLLDVSCRAAAPSAPFFLVLASVLLAASSRFFRFGLAVTSARGAGSPALDTLDNACSELNDFWVDRAALARLRAALQLALLSFASHVSSHW